MTESNVPPDMPAYSAIYGVEAAKHSARPHQCDLCNFEHASTPNKTAHEAWVEDQVSHGFVRDHGCAAQCLGATVWAVQHPA